MSVADEVRHPAQQLLTSRHGSHPEVATVELEQFPDHGPVEGRSVALQGLLQDKLRLGQVQAGPLRFRGEETQRLLDVSFQACAHAGGISHAS